MVKRLKKSIPLVGLVALVGCTTAAATYPWYILDLPSYEGGHLRGPEPEQDLEVRVCEPDDFDQGKCVVMMRVDHERLETDFQTCRTQLAECQSNLFRR